MAGIDNKLVDDYINGNDIIGISLEQLEDNKIFMENVIATSNDYKMYYHASNRVKGDIGFVKFLIKKFKDKTDFLCEVADNYFDSAIDDYNSIELAIIMTAFLKGKDDDRFLKYKMMRDVLYAALRLQVERVKNSEKDDYEFQCDTGMGFAYILETYGYNEIVTDFCAKKMLNELFVEDYYALDRILHNQYSSVNKMESKGIYNVLINAIRLYDDFLANYVCIRKELLKRVIDKYNNVIKRWDNYVDVDEVKRFDKVFEEVEEYMSDKEYDSFLSGRELGIIAGIDLRIEEKLVKYGILDHSDIKSYREDSEYYDEILKNSFNDRSNLNNIKRIMKSLLLNNKIEPKEEKQSEKTCKILSLEDYKKKLNKIKSRQIK